MKYAIFGIVIAVLGFGEYVFVNVMPFPAEKRLQKLESLPVVRNAVDMRTKVTSPTVDIH